MNEKCNWLCCYRRRRRRCCSIEWCSESNVSIFDVVISLSNFPTLQTVASQSHRITHRNSHQDKVSRDGNSRQQQQQIKRDNFLPKFIVEHPIDTPITYLLQIFRGALQYGLYSMLKREIDWLFQFRWTQSHNPFSHALLHGSCILSLCVFVCVRNWFPNSDVME